MTKKKFEKSKASIKAILLLLVLLGALSGIGKEEVSKEGIPIYTFSPEDIHNTPFHNSLPHPTSTPHINNSFAEKLKSVFSESAAKSIQEKVTNSTNQQTSSTKYATPNAYPSGEAFSSYFSKADYHYEEAEKLTQKPKLLSKGTFVYPQKAWDRDIEGTYKARLWVNVDGEVIKVDVLDVDDTFGFASAIKQMGKSFRYEPVIVRGRPVPFTIIVPFEFSLN